MRKSSSINSFLTSVYFSLFNIVANPRMGIVCRILVCVVLNVVVFPCFSMVYCIDDVIIGSESSLNSETVALETKPPGPISNKENISTVAKRSKWLLIGVTIAIALLVVLWGSPDPTNTNVDQYREEYVFNLII